MTSPEIPSAPSAGPFDGLRTLLRAGKGPQVPKGGPPGSLREMRSEKHPANRHWARVSLVFLALALSLFVLIPFFWVSVTAVKTTSDMTAHPLGLPQVWHWENFAQAVQQAHLLRLFRNSVIVVVPVVLACLVLSTLAGYAFAKMTWRGKEFWFIVFLLGLAIPTTVLIVPLYFELNALHLTGSLWGLILVESAGTLPFGVLLMRGFIADISDEIIDASRIDGCTSLGTLWYIVAPLTKPALLTLLIFNFMWSWNAYLLPLVLVQKQSLQTLPLGLQVFAGRWITNYPLIMAATIISIFPIVVVYVIFQRQFIQGLSAGAFK
ncbi:MAG: carbohydrate ABC transporter permease [Anaerolineae bacterium]